MEASSLSPLTSCSLCHSPDRSQNLPVSTRVTATLENALPGVNANNVIHALDTLLGSRSYYTLVGSAAMHLHALEHPNATCKLPLPHDLDVVVNDTAIRRVELASPETLDKLNLKRDANFAHVLHMKRENAPDLKIDIVHSHTPGFSKYHRNPHSIHGVQVGRLADNLADYKARLRDPEFIEQCGGQNEANAKIQSWLNYFDQFDTQTIRQLSTQAKKRPFNNTTDDETDSPRASRPATRILRFGD